MDVQRTDSMMEPSEVTQVVNYIILFFDVGVDIRFTFQVLGNAS